DEGGDDDAASSVDTELQAESVEADAGTSSEARMAALRARAIQIERDEGDAAEMARRNEAEAEERPAYAPLPGEDVEINPRAVARYRADRRSLAVRARAREVFAPISKPWHGRPRMAQAAVAIE
ncbi:unnamed protein product, partial [Prorocentrum cordatum]